VTAVPTATLTHWYARHGQQLAVRMLQDRLGLSERRACRFAGQNRSTQRHCPQVAQDDQALRKLSTDHPRWGYRRAHGTCSPKGGL